MGKPTLDDVYREWILPKQQRPKPAKTRLLELLGSGRVRSQAEAARLLGVSRQRINQLVQEERIDLKLRPKACEQCGRKLGRRSIAQGVCGVCRRSELRSYALAAARRGH